MVVFYWSLSSKVVFNRRLSSIKVCLPSKVPFYWRSSFIKGHLPSKFIFHLRSFSSSIEDQLPFKTALCYFSPNNWDEVGFTGTELGKKLQENKLDFKWHTRDLRSKIEVNPNTPFHTLPKKYIQQKKFRIYYHLESWKFKMEPSVAIMMEIVAICVHCLATTYMWITKLISKSLNMGEWSTAFSFVHLFILLKIVT